MENNNLIKDTVDRLLDSSWTYTDSNQVKYLMLSESEYNKFAKHLGENLGYDPVKVKVIKGLPLFGISQNT